MSPAIRLRRGVRPVRRGQDQVQFGVRPDPGVVLGGLTEAEVRFLLGLDRARSAGPLRAGAAPARVHPTRMAHLLGMLEHCGLVAQDPGPEGRLRARQVCVLGRGQLPELVREQLSRCGVGQVSAAWSETAAPDLVVLVTAHAVAPQEAPLWLGRGLPHLPVIAHSRSSLVGPVVRPHQGPCLHCLDLHRRDRDGAWPRMLAQLAPTATDLADPIDPDPALAGATAAVCAMVVRGYLTTGSTPPGTTWEVGLPWGEVTGRRWPAHPACPCQEPVT